MDDVLIGSAFTALLLVAGTAAWTALTLTRAATAQLAGVPTTLGLYETAYLRGGPRRVINTALVALVSQGGVHVSREGDVTPVAGFGVDRRQPIEVAVFQQVKRVRQGRAAAQVRHVVARHEAMDGLVDDLRAAGLLKGPRAVRQAARPLWWLRVVTAVAGVVALVSLIPMPSILPAAVEVAGAAVVIGLIGLFVLGKRLNMWLAVPGGKVREAELSGSAGSVALHGLTKLPDRELVEALRKDTRARRSTNRRVGGGYVATCCAPGHCGSYGQPQPVLLHGNCSWTVDHSADSGQSGGGSSGCGSGSSSCGGSSGCGGGGGGG